MACAAVAWKIESFTDLIARDLSSRCGNFSRLMALSNMTSTSFKVSIEKRVVKDNPRAELVWLFSAIRWLALKQNC